MHKTGGFLHIQQILKCDTKRARRDKECAPQQKAWSDADYKQTEKAMRRDYDHVIYGLEGWKIPASERMEKQEEIINEDKLKSVLTERQYKRLHLYAVMNMTLEQIADIEHVSIQSVSRSIHAAKKKILKFLSKQGEKVPF